MILKYEIKLYVGRSDLCESILKIVFFVVVIYFRLLFFIMVLSSEDDRFELRVV